MPAMQPPIRLLTWSPLLEPRLARARQPPQSPPCATPNPENRFDCVPEAHASLMRAGRRRHTTERDGTRRTEEHGLPEPCRRPPARVEEIGGGSAWESNPPKTPRSPRHRF